MAEAEAKLAKDIEQGLKERINIENVENDERVIEMNIGLLVSKRDDIGLVQLYPYFSGKHEFGKLDERF